MSIAFITAISHQTNHVLFLFAKLVDVHVLLGLASWFVMATTMNSGIVICGINGGNTAFALTVVVMSQLLATFTIPFFLPLYYKTIRDSANSILESNDDGERITMKIELK